MFSQKEFIDVSRSFVCIRIETYENKKSEEMVRSLLNGRYANTAFCMFDPQGTRRLSRSGRSPGQVMGHRAEDSDAAVISEMKRIAKRYTARGEKTDTVLQDFLSFRQALNVASADQRLLVFINADKDAAQKLSTTLKPLFADEEVIGRFHLDFLDDDDKEWTKAIMGAEASPAINIIRSGTFGQEGTVMQQLPLTASVDTIKKTLLAANKEFSSSEKRKTYAEHVMAGKRQGIKYETEIPYGEDRDGDGQADRRRGRSGGRGGRRGGGNRRP